MQKDVKYQYQYCNETVSCQFHRPHVLVICCKFALEIVNSIHRSIFKFPKPWNTIPISTQQNLTIFIHFFACFALANKYNHAKLRISNFMFSCTSIILECWNWTKDKVVMGQLNQWKICIDHYALLSAERSSCMNAHDTEPRMQWHSNGETEPMENLH